MYLNFNAKIIRQKEKISFYELESIEKAYILQSLTSIVFSISSVKCPIHTRGTITITFMLVETSVKVVLSTCCTMMAALLEVALQNSELDVHLCSQEIVDQYKWN